MPEVVGFRALRYVKERVGSFDNVVTPPFDVISPSERAELMAKSPYNWVHVILPEERNGMHKYASAADHVAQWRHDGILKQDDADSFYILEQRFRDLDGHDRVRHAFFGCARIPEANERTILGHERTFAFKVTDRLALTEATGLNQGAVFLLYADPEKRLHEFKEQAKRHEPDLIAHTIDGVTQRMWRVPASPAVTKFFSDQTLYIADGHHRYRTACEYRDRMRQIHGTPSGGLIPRYEYVMAGFVDMADPGLIVYPAHRVLDPPANLDVPHFLKSLEHRFEVTPVHDHLQQHLETESARKHPARHGCTMGLVTREHGMYILQLKSTDRVEFLGDDHGPAWRDLDVSVLHRGILERMMGLPQDAEFVYEVNAQKAIDLVTTGQKRMAFILDKMRPEQVCACADSDEYMPQKATYFFPKLCSGAVMHLLAL
jgi:uncharacterized protein (DUF1015 family)